MGVLTDRVAIVTGGGSGLGRAVALSLAKEGASIVLCGRRRHKIDEVRREITEAGGAAIAVRTDISDEGQIQECLDQTMMAYGRMDILVNNAAVFAPGLFTETNIQDWNYQITVNLTGTFLMTKACLPYMRKQNYGRIINVTSGLAANGAGGFAAYSVTKAGIESMTRTVAEEESNFDILVNLFDPGTLRTEMHATGKDPMSVAPDFVKLASLPKRGASGMLFRAGDVLFLP